MSEGLVQLLFSLPAFVATLFLNPGKLLSFIGKLDKLMVICVRLRHCFALKPQYCIVLYVVL